MKIESKVFLDTNILVYATLFDFEPNKHNQSNNSIKNLSKNNHQIYISTQILREFYAVVTNKKYLNNPLSIQDAKAQIDFFSKSFEILPIDLNTITKLKELLLHHEIRGQKIHDTTIAASMLEYGINQLFTYNLKDFKVFDEINVLSPEEYVK